MNKLLNYFERLPDSTKVIGCLLFNLLLGCVDFITKDFSLRMFYLLPIAFAAWFINVKTGIFISIVCSLEIVLIQMFSTPAIVSLANVKLWDMLMEACYLFLAAYLLSRLKISMEQAKQRSLELEAANLDLKAFNYTVAHDLRSPLVWIGGYCRSILKHHGNSLPENPREQLWEVCEGIQRAEILIDTLLDLSSMAQGELTCVPVDLSEIAKSVAEELMLAEPGKKVTFLNAKDIACSGDKRLLRVVLQNLLNNAWKYTGEQKEPVIEFGVLNCNGMRTFFVSDNGAGFDMTFAGNLFIPFQRLPEDQTSSKGTALVWHR